MAGTRPNPVERKSQSAARMLIRALRAIEKFSDDPQMILDDAVVESHQDDKGVKDALEAIRRHYLEDEQ